MLSLFRSVRFATRMVATRPFSSFADGEQFKAELRAGKPKFGLFVNSASTSAAQQLSYSGYDWLLVDKQHGSMDNSTLSNMLNAVHLGKSRSLVRVSGCHDRDGIQQALDAGAHGILVPYINTKEEAELAVSACLYPTAGTRSVYHPQPSNYNDGLLGYVPNANKNVFVALQVETASCIKNIDEIAAVKGVDCLFLGQNDLAMSMGLFEKYQFPDMYFSPELNQATQAMLNATKKNGVINGIFLFGTDRVEEFMKKGFNFVSVGNDLHSLLTQTAGHVQNLEKISKNAGNSWTRQSTKLF